MEKILFDFFSTPVGELILASYGDKLCMADWRYRKMRNAIDLRITKIVNAEFFQQESSVIVETKKQLNEYFVGERKVFDLPLLLAGTDFQKQVWNELINIKFGQVETYLGLSARLQNPKAIRAVAAANGANAISIIVPCHRIIGSNRELIGYAGGLPAKRKLLKLEGFREFTQLSLFS
jgi:methylated-DNA-[protein]-cysteine S-methyltransferase